MKGILTTVCFLLLGTPVFAQVKFEKGYFISNDGKRTECEIRNMDWNSNPTSFQYRVDGGEPQEAILEVVTEFGIAGDATFRRFTVNIDRSSDITANLSDDRNPAFKQETLFLRTLVSGKAILYEYVDGMLKRFFYAVDAGIPTQLVYKRYMQSNASGTYRTGFSAVNEQYKQQIFLDMKCGTISKRDVENLKYERAPLMKIFSKYNECTGTAVATAEPEERKAPTHLALRPGLFSNGFYFDNGTTRREFDRAIAFRLGLEVEIVLPFYKNMWSVTFEPAYQTYSSKISGTSFALDYSSIDFNLSVRRYLFIKESGSLYMNFGLAYGLPLNGKGALQTGGTPLDVAAGTNLTAGLGFRKGKFSGEFNYAFSRGLMGDYIYYTSGYSGPGLILGYQFR